MKEIHILSAKELEKLLQSHPAWQLTAGQLGRTLTFKNFSQAWAFMSRVALLAEQMGHHPDWSNTYNKVELQLFTHDKKALTSLDEAMLKGIDKLLVDFKVL